PPGHAAVAVIVGAGQILDRIGETVRVGDVRRQLDRRGRRRRGLLHRLVDRRGLRRWRGGRRWRRGHGRRRDRHWRRVGRRGRTWRRRGGRRRGCGRAGGRLGKGRARGKSESNQRGGNDSHFVTLLQRLGAGIPLWDAPRAATAGAYIPPAFSGKQVVAAAIHDASHLRPEAT